MCLAPVSFALIVIAVLEEKGLEALPRPTLVVDGIRACAAKVTDGLMLAPPGSSTLRAFLRKVYLRCSRSFGSSVASGM